MMKHCDFFYEDERVVTPAVAMEDTLGLDLILRKVHKAKGWEIPHS